MLSEKIHKDIYIIYGVKVKVFTLFPKYLIIVIDGNNSSGNTNFEKLYGNTLHQGERGYYLFGGVYFETDGRSTIIKIDYTFNKINDIWEYIEGPCSISEHYDSPSGKNTSGKNMDNKHIYLIGDFHVKNSLCMDNTRNINLGKMIERTVKYNKNKMIDIFIETTYRRYDNKGNLDFPPEILYNKLKSLELKNIRLHYTDFRTILEQKFGIIGLLYKVMLISNTGSEVGISELKLYIGTVIQKLLKYVGDDTFDFLFSIYNVDGKILKQINNVDEPMRSKIASFFRNEHKNYTKSFVLGKMYSFLTLLDTTLLEDSKVAISKFTVEWIAFILDIYIISRVYRNFRSIPNKYSESPNNIIIYAGEHHIKTYRKFLDNSGTITIASELSNASTLHDMFKESMEKGTFNCIKIEKFRQPFFYINEDNYYVIPNINITYNSNFKHIINNKWKNEQKSYISGLDYTRKDILYNYIKLYKSIKYFIDGFDVDELIKVEDIIIELKKLYLESSDPGSSDPESSDSESGNTESNDTFSFKIAMIYFYMYLKDIMSNSPKSNEDIVLYYDDNIKYMYENNYVITDMIKININEIITPNHSDISKLFLNRNILLLDDTLLIDDQIILTTMFDSKLLNNSRYYNELNS